MPSMFGDSNTDKDYAPHMWIGDHFVGSTVKLNLGDKVYVTGVADTGPVAECADQILTGDEVPAEVRQAAYAEQARRKAEIESVKAQFREEGLTRE